MKFRVVEDVSIVIGQDKEQTFKAGVHEAKEANRAALEKLVDLGYAELVKSSSKEA